MNSFRLRFILALLTCAVITTLVLWVGDRSSAKLLAVDVDEQNGFLDTTTLFVFTFSEPVKEQIFSEINFVPEIPGEWKVAGRRAVFTPASALPFTTAMNVSVPSRKGFFSFSRSRLYFSWKTPPVRFTYLGVAPAEVGRVYTAQWPQKDIHPLTPEDLFVHRYDISENSGVMAYLASAAQASGDSENEQDQTSDTNVNAIYVQHFDDSQNPQKLPSPSENFRPVDIDIDASGKKIMVLGAQEILETGPADAVYVLSRDDAAWQRLEPDTSASGTEKYEVSFTQDGMIRLTYTSGKTSVFDPIDSLHPTQPLFSSENNIKIFDRLDPNMIDVTKEPWALGIRFTDTTSAIIALSSSGEIMQLSDASFQSVQPFASPLLKTIAFVAPYDPINLVSAPYHILGFRADAGVFSLSQAEPGFSHQQPSFSALGSFLAFERCEGESVLGDETPCPLALLQENTQKYILTDILGKDVQWLSF